MAIKTCTGTTSQPYVHVQARLSQAATITATGLDAPLVTDATGAVGGTYSISLWAASDLTPTGTYYTITEFLGTTDNTFNVQVPASAGPFAMSSILVGTPTASATPNHVSTLIVDGTSGVAINAAGDIAARSVTVSSSSPYTNTLPGNGAVATPAGVVAATGVWPWGNGEYHVMAAGAKGDAQFITDAVMNGTTAVLTSASNPFAATDVGKLITVPGAGAAGAPLCTTIASYQSAGQVTLTAVSQTAVAANTTSCTTWGTDDYTAIQATITAAQAAKGRMIVPSVAVGYCMSGVPVVNGSLDIDGGGVKELFGSFLTYPNDVNMPAVAPFLIGAVLIPMALNNDGMQFTQAGLTANARGIGIRFGNLYNSTGHGFNVIPPVDGANYDLGLTGAEWSGLKVYGHDGNHVGVKIINPFYLSLRHLRSYGGGGLLLRGDSSRFPYGNVTIDSWYSVMFLGGTAHGIELQASTAQKLNLLAFIRPQSWIYSPATAITGTTPPINTNLMVKVDANVQRVHWFDIDVETNVSSTATFGTEGQIITDGAGRSNAMELVPQTDAKGGLIIAQHSATQAGDLLRVQGPGIPGGATLFKIDASGNLAHAGSLNGGGAATGNSLITATSGTILALIGNTGALTDSAKIDFQSGRALFGYDGTSQTAVLAGSKPLQIKPSSTGSIPGVDLIPPAIGSLTSEATAFRVSAWTATITGGYAAQKFNYLQKPTVSAATSLTVTTAATLAIEDGPAASGAGPAVITNPAALWLQSGLATPAGGSAVAGILFGSAPALGVYFGSGAPTNSAKQGSLYLRTDGSSTSTRAYINTNGSTTWTNVTTAA